MTFIKNCFLPSVREKEENIKTVQGQLEKGLLEVANKEEELKVSVFSCLERVGHGQQSLKKAQENLLPLTHTHPHLTDISML